MSKKLVRLKKCKGCGGRFRPVQGKRLCNVCRRKRNLLSKGVTRASLDKDGDTGHKIGSCAQYRHYLATYFKSWNDEVNDRELSPAKARRHS